VVAQLNPLMSDSYGDAVPPAAEVDLAIEVDLPLSSPTARRGSGAAAR
jgi:hypothetical protein